MDTGTTKKAGWLTTEEYDFIYSRVPRFCVDLLIKDKNGSILLSLRKIEPYMNTWHFPGGKVNFRESIEDAIQRVAKAELGTEVVVGKVLGYMEFPDEIQKSQNRHSISIVFSAELKDENVTGSWQAEKIQFFPEIPVDVLPIHGNFIESLS